MPLSFFLSLLPRTLVFTFLSPRFSVSFSRYSIFFLTHPAHPFTLLRLFTVFYSLVQLFFFTPSTLCYTFPSALFFFLHYLFMFYLVLCSLSSHSTYFFLPTCKPSFFFSRLSPRAVLLLNLTALPFRHDVCPSLSFAPSFALIPSLVLSFTLPS